MKKMTIVIVVMLVMAVFMPTHAFAGSKDSVEVDLLDISEMPKTAVRQENAHFQYAVYVNVDKPASGEGEMDDVRSVWLANERSGTVIKVCVTNPMAEPQWSKMSGKEADGVSVPLTQIAAAHKAMIAPGDVSKVIVEGCPDGRNVWQWCYYGTETTTPQYIIFNNGQSGVGVNQTKDLTFTNGGWYQMDGTTTSNPALGINGIKADAQAENNAWYNIAGQRVSTPTQKGLYLHNGKKIVIR